MKNSDKIYDLCCITTFTNSDSVYNLLDSLKYNNNQLSIIFIFINQTESDIVIPNYHIDFCIIKTSRTSLSKARNNALQYLFKNNILYTHLMFPDDDSSFSPDFFLCYKELIKSNFNYLIDVYCIGSTNIFKPNKYKNHQKLTYINYDAAMSVNMIISQKNIHKTNYFDENLGVGSRFGGGEDVDFFIRVCKDNISEFEYVKDIYYYHPSPNSTYSNLSFKKILKRFIAYGDGTIYALCKNKMYLPAAYISIRGLGGFFISLITFNLKLSIAYLVSFTTRVLMIFKFFLIYDRLNNKYND